MKKIYVRCNQLLLISENVLIHLFFLIHWQHYSSLNKSVHCIGRLTCSGAHAPRWKSVWCCKTVEHTDVTRCQKLHKLCVFELILSAVQDSCSLFRNVHNLPRDQGHRNCKNILYTQKQQNSFRHSLPLCSSVT